jgi:hypothetical protein
LIALALDLNVRSLGYWIKFIMTDTPLLIRAKSRYNKIKAYYLNMGHSEQQWQTISNNPQLFNAVWRQMLGLPCDTTPPHESLRS